jgi:hypothetical protein
MAGGFNPAPTLAGGEAGHIVEVLVDDLLEADGTALAKDETAYLYAERMAEARCIAYLYSTLERAKNQSDPMRMTDFIPRWESILGVYPLPGDSYGVRRARIGAKLAIGGELPTRQVVNDLLTSLLGTSVYLGIVNTSSSEAVGYVKGGCTIPGGVTLPDGVPLGITWYSTIAHVLFLVSQPAAMDDTDFAAALGQLRQSVDDLLPAWVTWDWVEDYDGSGEGFYLDDLHNLNVERFDS